ncbi:VirB8/TrbF family protein [Tepidicaulis sp. LMO-SS28]|uniref:VirB8/TrbF family protein n=1 Tax=Tepidicaulis sp. LMO-SS28 TaxID=3447455 RepID=UPI003EE3C218
MDWLKAIRPGREKEEALPGSPHGAAAAADPYAFQAAHRRLAWMLRLSAGTNIVLGAAVTALVSMFSVMLPLKETEIALVRTDPADDRIYRVEPITERTEGFQLLMESMARRYVQLVLAIDPVTSNERYREASRMTARALSERLREERIETDEVRDAIASGLTREIRVESVDGITSFGRDHKFAVDFTQVDQRSGRTVQRKKLRAYLSMTTRPHETREEDKYMNPLGVVVTAMTLKERG